jgi:hypothetical protein
MNPADQAQIAAAKYNAEMARRDAGNLMTSATENAGLFTTKAEQQLAEGMAILGKTGNLSTETNAPVQSGLALGSKVSQETIDYRTQLETTIADLNKQLTNPNLDQQGGMKSTATGTVQVAPGPSSSDIKDKLKAAEDALAILSVGGGTKDISSPEALLHASGSDLLTMVNTRDALERDKRTLIRNAQSQAISMFKAGEQYDTQAKYAESAANWNMWSTILGGGLKIASTFF